MPGYLFRVESLVVVNRILLLPKIKGKVEAADRLDRHMTDISALDTEGPGFESHRNHLFLMVCPVWQPEGSH